MIQTNENSAIIRSMAIPSSAIAINALRGFKFTPELLIVTNRETRRENSRGGRRRNQDRLGLGRTRRRGTANRRGGETSGRKFPSGYAGTVAHNFSRTPERN